MSDFKSRLKRMKDAANQVTQKTGGTSRFAGRATNTGSISRFGNNAGAEAASGALSKFKRRSQEVLDTAYNTREDRSKAGALGKNIYNEEHLEEFGIKQFKLAQGDIFFDLLPLSFEPSVPFYRECQVHFGVGFSGDKFICPYRFQGQPCYRCEIQQGLFRKHGKVTEEIKKLYPGDRAVYLLYNRTNEILQNAPPLDYFEIWDVPKGKVHGEILGRARDKINQKTFDISDLTPGGQGRTITCTIGLDGRFPTYGGFDLLERQVPIPNEMIDMLADIIDELINKGYEQNPYDYFLHVPTAEEIKESMDTESLLVDAQQKDQDFSGAGAGKESKSAASRWGNRGAAEPRQSHQESFDPQRLVQHFENLQQQLKAMNIIEWRKWLNTDGAEYKNVVADMDRNEAINGIVADLFDQECIKLGIDPNDL